MNTNDPTSGEGRCALEAIAQALKEARGREQEQLAMIATIAICMLHGTFGREFCREYLLGAMAELDLPNPMKIKLEVHDARQPH